MTHPRADWTLQDYIEELERVYYYEPTMDPSQWKQLKVLIETEIKARFPESVRKENMLSF